MSSLIKYRIHEFAKDFGMTSKEVSAILTDYLTPPKNHMQALSEEELNFLFDYITQRNQIDSIEEVFAETYQEPSEDQVKPQTADKAKKSPEDGKTPVGPEKAAKKAEDNRQVPQPAAKDNQHVQVPIQTQPRVRIIDTRGATVDLGKYDERIESLVPEKAQKVQQGKEKIKKQAGRGRSQYVSNKRRQEEQDKMRRLREEMLKKQTLKVSIPDEIAVGELATRLKKTGADVVRQLIKLGVMASLSDVIDFDTASLVAMEFGAKIEKEINITIEERLIDDSEDAEENLVRRDPVVVVMGHVDHGKTSLLDSIRKTHVVSGEAGGITQHIGAYRVHLDSGDITFLDTPGHAAFTSMRARGASITDIAILVVAADDGIMPQTVEAINHAKAANVPIVVAVNKMDKPEANPDRVMQQLTEYGMVPEEWGGDTIICKVSAFTGEGIDNLLEMILLTAEMAELKANPDRAARGTVIEAKLDKGRGPVTTLLVQNGTLKQGDILIAGKSVGRVRAMTNDKGERIESAGPSVPVEVIGMSEVPGAGDIFYAVEDERMARELAEQRRQQEKDESSKTVGQKVSLEDVFNQIQEGQLKELNIIVKADVQGTAEALKASLEKLTNEEVRVKVIHSGVGAVNESDILLASAASAIVVGFNVRPEPSARDSAARSGVEIRLYRVIYECLEEMEAAMKGLLAPRYEERELGTAEVRQTFKVSGIGTIAGCYVKEGKITRSAKVRIVRDGIVIHEGELASLRRFKDDVREVAAGYECGIGIERFNDIKDGDLIECYEMVEIKR